MKPDQEVRRGDAYGLSLLDFQLSTLNCLTRIRRNKARMSMKTKDEVKKSRNPSPGSILSPPSPHRRGLFDSVRFAQPPLEPGNCARKHKNRENELNKLLRINDLTFLALENELGLMCKIGPIQAKKLEIGGEEAKQKRLAGPGASQHEPVGGVAVVEI